MARSLLRVAKGRDTYGSDEVIHRWCRHVSLTCITLLGLGVSPAVLAAPDTQALVSAIEQAISTVPQSARHAEYVLQGNAAQAQGQVRAAKAVFNEVRQDFTADLAALQHWMQTTRVRTDEGYPNPNFKVPDATLITMYLPSNDLVTSPAGRDMASWIADNRAADAELVSAFTAAEQAFELTTEAGSLAVVANFSGETADRQAAQAAATQAATRLGEAVGVYHRTHQLAWSLGDQLPESNSLDALVPVNFSYTEHLPNRATYFSPGDASFASATFSAYSKALQHSTDRKVVLEELLAAFAQAGGYAQANLGKSSDTVAVNDSFNLLLPGLGQNTFSLGTSTDHVLVSAVVENVTLRGFQPGPSGDQVQFAGIGDRMNIRRLASGAVELVSAPGGQRVVLPEVDITKLDLFVNLVGVTTLSFENDIASGLRRLRRHPFFDGYVHANELIASSHGDTLVGGRWGSILRGGAGNDVLVVTGTDCQVSGGDGSDTVSYYETNKGADVSLLNGTDNFGSTLASIENVTGSVRDDRVWGDSGNNRIKGNAGNDLLVGGGGNDIYVFERGDGSDIVRNGLSSNSGPTSSINLEPDIAADELWFEQVGEDMLVRILGGNDTILVEGWYANRTNQVATLSLADGSRISAVGMTQWAADLAAWHLTNPDIELSVMSYLPGELVEHRFTGTP